MCEGQALALAQRRHRTVRAKRPTRRSAIDRGSAQDRCEFKGESVERPRKSHKRPGPKAFHIDFGKNRLAMKFDELVKGDGRDDEATGADRKYPSNDA
jgi:hypothetical protein